MVIFISTIILIENDILTVDNQFKFNCSFIRKQRKSVGRLDGNQQSRDRDREWESERVKGGCEISCYRDEFKFYALVTDLFSSFQNGIMILIIFCISA